jgi:hypothetical protein
LIYFLHEKNPQNPGDFSCSPAQYYDFGKPSEVHSILAYQSLRISKSDVVIFGGGGLLNEMYLHKLRHIAQLTNNVAFWGVGTNKHFWHGRLDSIFKESMWRFFFDFKTKFRLLLKNSIYPKFEFEILQNAKLVGVRDSQNDFPIVPCPSCLHTIFDNVDNSNNRDIIGVIGHDDFLNLSFNKPFLKIPYIGANIETVVEQIAKCTKVITSSYHCAYWALLLGKEVEIKTFSSKHWFLKPLLQLSKADGLCFLDWCRKRNLNFRNSIDLIL